MQSWRKYGPGVWLITCDEANISVFTDLPDLQGLNDFCDKYVGVNGQNPFPSPQDVLDYFSIGPLCPTLLRLSIFYMNTETGWLCHVNVSLLHRLRLMRQSSTPPLACLHSGGSPAVYRHETPPDCTRVDRIKPRAKMACRSSIQNPDNYRITEYRH